MYWKYQKLKVNYYYSFGKIQSVWKTQQVDKIEFQVSILQYKALSWIAIDFQINKHINYTWKPVKCLC